MIHALQNYPKIILLAILSLLPYLIICDDIHKKSSQNRLKSLQDKVKSIFYHSYNNYLNLAFPKDELQPITCQGRDTWGSFSLTLIDSLDTLLVLGNKTEFARVAKYLSENLNFDYDFNVSVFESNIRVLGGLISAHILAGTHIPKHLFNEGENSKIVPPEWPCKGKLLDLAVEIADKLLPAFDTKTKMPYGTVNLKNGVPKNETPITCTACIGTFLIEFGTLSLLTGNPIYRKVADQANDSLFRHRTSIDLVGNHIDTKTGRWIAQEASIGGAIDSYFEYLVKASILFKEEKYFEQFLIYKKAIDKYTKTSDGLYYSVNMATGTTVDYSMESLSCFFPGVETLYGDVESAMKTVKKLAEIADRYGGFPEKFDLNKNVPIESRSGYPLRPELIESIWYLFRSTRNPLLIDIAENLLFSIEKLSKTKCGFATIKSVLTHQLEDRMESFFLAETLKYFYLIFDPENFLNDQDENYFYMKGDIFRPDNETECILNSGGYVFNTEAHPVDPGVECCLGYWENQRKQQNKSNSNSQSTFADQKPTTNKNESSRSKSPNLKNLVKNGNFENFDTKVLKNLQKINKIKPIEDDFRIKEFYADSDEICYRYEFWSLYR